VAAGDADAVEVEAVEIQELGLSAVAIACPKK
jgi:hypothetical protein